MKSTKYDPDVIQVFANKLYSKANSIIVASTVLGVIIGGVGGFAALQNRLDAIIGALVLGLIGFLIGESRAFTLKLQAQTSLCQVQIEKNIQK